MTSDKAFRSGDGKTIAVLVESHHKSLQLMANHSSQLEAIARAAQQHKHALTTHIHSRLKLVMQLQKKVADSNGQLVLLHEHIKLAHKRFEILEQVCSTPQVLVEVFGEISRRRSYNAVLEKVMEETSSRLQKAREEEKHLRRDFRSNHGVHFVTTLFPELQDRVPDITFHSPKSLSKSYDDNLEMIRSLIPQNMKPSAQSASSVQILAQPISFDSELSVDPPDLSSGDALKLVKGPQLKTSARTTDKHLEEGDGDSEQLKELVGRLELSNVDLSLKLQQCHDTNKSLKTSLAVKESTYLTASQRLKDHEVLITSLQQQVSDLEESKKLHEGEKLLYSQRVVELEQNNRQSVEKLTQMSQELQQLNVQCDQLTVEREKALDDMKETNSKTAENSIVTQKLEEDCSQLRDRLRQAGTHHDKEMGDLKVLLSKSEEDRDRLRQAGAHHDKEMGDLKTKFEEECSQLKDRLRRAGAHHDKEMGDLKVLLSKSHSTNQQLIETNEVLRSKASGLESRLSELQQNWELQRQKLEDEVTRYQEDQKTQKETLREHSTTSDELTATRSRLHEKETALELCKAELSLIKKECEHAEKEMGGLKDELSREQQSSQQALATMKLQLETLDAKKNELVVGLGEREAEKNAISAELEQMRHVLSERERELSSLKAKHNVELEALEGKRSLACEKALAAEQREKELENAINQTQPRISDLEKKLKSAEEKISELEAELSRKKERLLSGDGRLQQAEQDLRRRAAELQASREEKARLKDELEHKLQERQAKLENTVRQHDLKKKEWETDKDAYIMKIMELEREVKELQRDVGQTSPPISSSPRKQVMHKMSSSATGLGPVSASMSSLPEQVAIHSLQVGQVALFMSDLYGNYLALSVDGKTYYLDSDSAQNLQELASKMPQLHLKWNSKILVGKIISKLYMEVRKENNRLKVPVGSRLYKIQAEAIC